VDCDQRYYYQDKRGDFGGMIGHGFFYSVTDV
jgi:hypothetical protein